MGLYFVLKIFTQKSILRWLHFLRIDEDPDFAFLKQNAFIVVKSFISQYIFSMHIANNFLNTFHS